MSIDQRMARAVYDRVQQTLAYASTHFGYAKPKRGTPVAVAPPLPVVPAPLPAITAQALAAAARRDELRRITAECLRKVDEAESAKAGWDRLAAKHHGTAAVSSETSEPDPHGWRALAAKHNAQQGLPATDGTKATAGPWDAFLPDRG